MLSPRQIQSKEEGPEGKSKLERNVRWFQNQLGELKGRDDVRVMSAERSMEFCTEYFKSQEKTSTTSADDVIKPIAIVLEKATIVRRQPNKLQVHVVLTHI